MEKKANLSFFSLIVSGKTKEEEEEKATPFGHGELFCVLESFFSKKK